MAEISMGTVYDVVKSVVKTEKTLTNTELKKRLKEIKQFFLTKNDKYFMLLNRETYNFTLFNLGMKDEITMKRIMQDLKECLQNRGQVISIDEADGAYEIWIAVDDDVLVYYLFPYDIGVIE